MDRIDNGSFTIVQKFLTVVELIGLRYVAKSFVQINIARAFRQSMLCTICRICNVDYKSAEALLARIDRHGGVISGSSILQALHDCEYKESDLDVYFNTYMPQYSEDDIVLQDILQLKSIPVLRPNNMRDYENEPNEEDQKMVVAPIFFEDCGKPYRAPRSSYTLIYNYKNRTVGESPYANVQVIGVRRGTWLSDHQIVTDHFDMTIVMNTYAKRTLEVYNTKYLLEKRNHACIEFPRFGRYAKYAMRGFPVYKPRETNINGVYVVPYDVRLRRIIRSSKDYFKGKYLSRKRVAQIHDE